MKNTYISIHGHFSLLKPIPIDFSPSKGIQIDLKISLYFLWLQIRWHAELNRQQWTKSTIFGPTKKPKWRKIEFLFLAKLWFKLGFLWAKNRLEHVSKPADASKLGFRWILKNSKIAKFAKFCHGSCPRNAVILIASLVASPNSNW